MADPDDILRVVVGPALELLPSRFDSPSARVMLLAICGQEADFHHRWQVVDKARPEVRGPARGLWQFERGGGVKGVLRHAFTAELAAGVCAERGIEATVGDVFARLERDDLLAGAFARLLLWSDPAPLPPIGHAPAAFSLYLRTWRPGAWDRGSAAERARLREKWNRYYAQAVEAVERPA